MDQNFSNYMSQNVNSFNVNVTNVIDEKSGILAWISSLESWKRHRDLSAARIGGVGGWVLETPEFQEWRDSDNGESNKALFCCGIPGAGKTFICSLVTDNLCNSKIVPNIGVACLYCDYSGWKEQSPVSMISSVLRQFVTGMPEMPMELVVAFRAEKGHLGGRALEVEKIIDIFPKVLASFDRTFICVDALDEFRVGDRAMFLQLLKKIIDKSPNTRLFLTGRLHIQPELDNQFNRPITTITVHPRQDDIRQYLTRKLDNDFEDGAMNDELREEIITKIASKDSEIFLLVALHIDAILGEITISKRREKLHQIGDDLSDAYGATIDRIKRERSKSGMAVLMWISSAERPLSVGELCHAMAVKVGASDLDPENVPSIQSVLGCCLGLVTVDQETSAVRLIHATLQEYLQSQPGIFESPHSTIAKVCLSYLGFQSLQRLSMPPEERSSETYITPDHTSARFIFLELVSARLPFLEYASCYWGIHAQKELTTSIELNAIKLLSQYPESIAAKIFLKKHDPLWRWNCADSDGFSGLHYASWTGIHKIVAALLRTGNYEVNEKDASGRTPLNLAARNGHQEVAETLLEHQDVDPDSTEENGRTPLFWAAAYGYEAVVKLLLDRADVNPGLADNDGRTPLSLASEHGYEGAVRLLLDRADVNPNLTDGDSAQTPLLWAAMRGHDRVVEILLDRTDINPNSADMQGRTPLSRAAERGYERVVRLLNRTDVNPNLTDDRCGQTPLSWAVVWGHEAVVKALLDRTDINPDLADNFGRTPLSWAATYGYEGMVRLLLNRADVNPNSIDHDHGQTPLAWAAEHGFEGVVNTLLDQAHICSISTNSSGQTMLHLAAKSGHHGVMKLLLEKTNLYPDTLDIYFRTPLSWAAGGGRLAVVELLLNWTDAKPDSADVYGRTPLSWAAGAGCEEIVTLLASRDDVLGDALDMYGQTPLFHAAESGENGIVGLLLSCQDVNLKRVDNNGRTILSWAAGNGKAEVVNTLLQQTDIHPDLPDLLRRTALSWAAEKGHQKVVESLLTRTDVNAESVDSEGRSPLEWALMNNHEGVVAVLLEWASTGSGVELLQN